MTTLLTGATGLTGTLLLERLARDTPQTKVTCLVRSTSNCTTLNQLNLKIDYLIGDSSNLEFWQKTFEQTQFDTIMHLVQLRHVPLILNALKTVQQTPRLIIIGTTGVYSQYNQYSAGYQQAETRLKEYTGSYCLLRPTMIYGSYRDKNIHKLIKFCHKYGFFPVFGDGKHLIQPIHADDIAQTLLYVWQHENIAGEYDISGKTVVSFQELLNLVAQVLEKKVYPLYLPLNLGISLATIAERILKNKSPVRREQILRLQEDKAYSYAAAAKDLNFQPRSLEQGLKEEVKLMQTQGII